MTAPTFEIIGDGRLSDEAIEALAALLLSVAEAEEEVGAADCCEIIADSQAESTFGAGCAPHRGDCESGEAERIAKRQAVKVNRKAMDIP